MTAPRKPSREEIRDATDKVVLDLIAPDLQVLFCGINPGLYSGATGHHFARPGNRFWPALHLAGFTPRRLSPFEEVELLRHGCGITNLVARTTATAQELSREELIAGGKKLVSKVRKHRPKVVAFLGVTAYRSAFDRPRATVGPQEETIGGSRIWVLPNPSGLNAHYQIADLARVFSQLRRDAGKPPERFGP